MMLSKPMSVPSLVSSLLIVFAGLGSILTLSSNAAASQQIVCSGCMGSFTTSPANGDTGLVASCQGFIELRLTIVPTDGICQANQANQCIAVDSCKFDIVVDYKARSCSMDLTENNNCDGPPNITGTYPPSYPSFTTLINAGSSQSCGTGCSLLYRGKCDTATGPCASGAAISATMNCSACTQLQ